MSENFDGGPAFPPNGGWLPDDINRRGLTIRDYFAAEALAECIYEALRKDDDEDKRSMRWQTADVATDAARYAYAIADAMLEARKR